MTETRQRFSEELRALEDEVQQTASQAQRLLEQALQALLGGDLAICDQVVRGDDEVDASIWTSSDASCAYSRSRPRSRATCGS
jgi:phosphate uptake regulator